MDSPTWRPVPRCVPLHMWDGRLVTKPNNATKQLVGPSVIEQE